MIFNLFFYAKLNYALIILRSPVGQFSLKKSVHVTGIQYLFQTTFNF